MWGVKFLKGSADPNPLHTITVTAATTATTTTTNTKIKNQL